MGIRVKISGGGKDFEPVSEGMHAVVLADIVDLGLVPTQYGPKEKLQFVWLTDETDEEGFTKRLFKRYTKSLHEKAGLRAAFIKIAGRDLTEAELASDELEIEPLLIGRQNQILVEQSVSDQGKVYANVANITKANPKVKVEVPSDFQRDKDKPADKRKGKPAGAAAAVKAAGGGRAVAAAVAKPATANVHGVTATDEDIPF